MVFQLRMGLALQSLAERSREPGFTDARLTRQQNDATLTTLCLSPATQQQVQLFLSSKERSLAGLMGAQRLETTVNATVPENLPCQNEMARFDGDRADLTAIE